MKNLFAVNKTDSKNAKNFDDNPYLVARISDEVRHKLDTAFENAFDEPEEPVLTPEEQAQKKRARILWLGSVLCLVGGFGLFLLEDRENPNLLMSTSCFALLIASTVLMFISRRIEQKMRATHQADRPEIDFSEATRHLQAAAEEAAQELGVPAGAVSLEILPYHYKFSGDKEVSAGKPNHFDNIAVSAYIENGNLCMASAQELFRVPRTAIRGKRVYDEEFVVDYWLKEEAPDSEKYAAFNIRKAGYLAQKCHTYYGVVLEDGYEFFVPCYDLDTLEALVTLPTVTD